MLALELAAGLPGDSSFACFWKAVHISDYLRTDTARHSSLEAKYANIK